MPRLLDMARCYDNRLACWPAPLKGDLLKKALPKNVGFVVEDIEIDRWICRILRSSKYILDVGCGDGRLVNILVKQHQKRVFGLDISNHGFGQANNTARQAALHALVEC